MKGVHIVERCLGGPWGGSHLTTEQKQSYVESYRGTNPIESTPLIDLALEGARTPLLLNCILEYATYHRGRYKKYLDEWVESAIVNHIEYGDGAPPYGVLLVLREVASYLPLRPVPHELDLICEGRPNVLSYLSDQCVLMRGPERWHWGDLTVRTAILHMDETVLWWHHLDKVARGFTFSYESPHG